MSIRTLPTLGGLGSCFCHCPWKHGPRRRSSGGSELCVGQRFARMTSPRNLVPTHVSPLFGRLGCTPFLTARSREAAFASFGTTLKPTTNH
jgi:hypothetical protein